jgi:Holliday junction resolvase
MREARSTARLDGWNVRYGRRDATHADIRKELRDLGASVVDTGDVGNDFTDLVVGLAGETFLVEAKARKGKLSDGQSEFARTWKGSPVVVLRSKIEAREWLIRTRHEIAGRNRKKELPCIGSDAGCNLNERSAP